MQLTYFGHACFSVKAGGKTILFDPFITGNELAKDIDVNSIEADYIFISHGHFDHILDVVTIAKRTGALVLGVWEVYDYFSKQGLQNVQPINPGGVAEFDFGKVKCVTAVHSSSFPDGSYAGVASGFVFQTKEGSFYYSGDTALTMDMTLIPQFIQPDFAVFPIGDRLTMGVQEAITAAGFAKVKKVVGVHYDTFGFIKLDPAKSKQAFESAGLELLLPAIGETIEI
ncbi:MAG: metal-dependent hydrolase [Chitinophagaceae bacterium]|nr:metal-dependent hydrolase [Chitinophagaceae bacterium]